jgi:ferritin-like metal-binding protein YciE
MRALIEGAERLIGDIEKSPVLDVALIAAARKVEHYEIAAYGAVCGIAETLGQQEVFSLLQETLEEEMEADAALEELAEALLNGDTMAVEEIEEEEIEEEEEEAEG